MNNKLVLLLGILLAAASVVGLAACLEREPQATSRPVLPATSVRLPPSPQAGAAPGGLGRVTLGDGLDALSSYRATFVLTATSFLTSSSQVNALVTMTDERSRSLDAEQVVYTFADRLRPGDYRRTEQVRLGNSSFLVIEAPAGAAQCLAKPIRQSDQWELMPFSYSDLGDLRDARYIGDETLDLPTGQARARHYTVARSLLGNFPTGRADIWIAVEGNYVIKLYAEAGGAGPFQSNPKFEGRLRASYQVSHINQPLPIAPPAACAGDTPIMPGAREINIAGNLTAFTIHPPASAVVEYYTREMRARGWDAVGEPSVSQDVTTLVFQRGEQVANVMIAPAAQNQAVQVAVILSTAR